MPPRHCRLTAPRKIRSARVKFQNRLTLRSPPAGEITSRPDSTRSTSSTRASSLPEAVSSSGHRVKFSGRLSHCPARHSARIKPCQMRLCFGPACAGGKTTGRPARSPIRARSTPQHLFNGHRPARLADAKHINLACRKRCDHARRQTCGSLTWAKPCRSTVMWISRWWVEERKRHPHAQGFGHRQQRIARPRRIGKIKVIPCARIRSASSADTPMVLPFRFSNQSLKRCRPRPQPHRDGNRHGRQHMRGHHLPTLSISRRVDQLGAGCKLRLSPANPSACATNSGAASISGR